MRRGFVKLSCGMRDVFSRLESLEKLKEEPFLGRKMLRLEVVTASTVASEGDV